MNTLPHGGWPHRPSPDDETTPLQLAELLLAAGANPNLQLKLVPPYRMVKDDRLLDEVLTTGATSLIRAAKAIDLPMMRLLLARGALPDLPTQRGITAPGYRLQVPVGKEVGGDFSAECRNNGTHNYLAISLHATPDGVRTEDITATLW